MKVQLFAAFREHQKDRKLSRQHVLLDWYPERHWAPLIGLFTGAREGEICQLHLNDIAYDEECKTWVIEFAPGGDKRLKNKYSERITPIHKTLIDLGFLKYVEQMRARGETQLFPREIPDTYGNWGRKVSRWFNGERIKDKSGKKIRRHGYKEKCGIIQSDNERKNFHSFRHTLINYGKQAGLDEKILREITGHSTGRKDAHAGYQEPYELAKRKNAIKKVAFDIDFDVIRRWC